MLQIARVSSPGFLKKLSESHTAEEREQASLRMSINKAEWDLKKNLEFAASTDLKTLWFGTRLHVVKSCEGCGSEFSITWGHRHRTYCGKACHIEYLANLDKRKNNQRQYFIDKQKSTLHDQVMMYKDLQDSLGRDPLKKEWEGSCRNEGVLNDNNLQYYQNY